MAVKKTMHLEGYDFAALAQQVMDAVAAEEKLEEQTKKVKKQKVTVKAEVPPELKEINDKLKDLENQKVDLSKTITFSENEIEKQCKAAMKVVEKTFKKYESHKKKEGIFSPEEYINYRKAYSTLETYGRLELSEDKKAIAKRFANSNIASTMVDMFDVDEFKKIFNVKRKSKGFKEIVHKDKYGDPYYIKNDKGEKVPEIIKKEEFQTFVRFAEEFKTLNQQSVEAAQKYNNELAENKKNLEGIVTQLEEAQAKQKELAGKPATTSSDEPEQSSALTETPEPKKGKKKSRKKKETVVADPQEIDIEKAGLQELLALYKELNNANDSGSVDTLDKIAERIKTITGITDEAHPGYLDDVFSTMSAGQLTVEKTAEELETFSARLREAGNSDAAPTELETSMDKVEEEITETNEAIDENTKKWVRSYEIKDQSVQELLADLEALSRIERKAGEVGDEDLRIDAMDTGAVVRDEITKGTFSMDEWDQLVGTCTRLSDGLIDVTTAYREYQQVIANKNQRMEAENLALIEETKNYSAKAKSIDRLLNAYKSLHTVESAYDSDNPVAKATHDAIDNEWTKGFSKNLKLTDDGLIQQARQIANAFEADKISIEDAKASLKELTEQQAKLNAETKKKPVPKAAVKEQSSVVNEQVTKSAEKSAEKVTKEDKAAKQAADSFVAAAKAKEQFVKANAKVAEAADESSAKVKKEGDALEQISERKAFLDPEIDKEEWDWAVNKSKEYREQLDRIVSIQRQLNGDKVSYLIKGTNRQSVTVARDSDDETLNARQYLVDNTEKIKAEKEAEKIIERIHKKLASFQDDGKYIAGITEEFERLQKQSKTAGWLDTQGLKDYEAAVNNFFASLKDGQNRFAEDVSISGLSAKMASFYDNNTRMPRKAKAEIRQMFETLHSGAQLSQTDLKAMANRFNEIVTEVKLTHKTGNSFFTSVGKQLRSANAQLVATYLSWQDFIRYGQQAFTTIRELDDALVDLKKTTTMSGGDLNAFYGNANNIAKDLGVTTKAIIEQASAWSRLNNLGLVKPTQIGETPEEDNTEGKTKISKKIISMV